MALAGIGTFSVQPGQLESLGAEIGSGAKNIATELNTLDSKVKTLEGAWDGAAKEAYAQTQAECQKRLDTIQQILAQIAQMTQTISQQYSQTDTHAAGYFG